MATGSGIGSGRLLEASRGGSANSRLGGGCGHDTGSEVAQAVNDSRASDATIRRVMDVLTDGAGYEFDACAHLGFGFAEFHLKAQAVSVRSHPALQLGS